MRDHAVSLLSAARRWFDEETVSQVFEPLIADWQHEPREHSRVGHLRWLVRGYLCFAAAFIASLPRQVQRRQPDATLLSGWMTTEGFAAAGIFAQFYLFFGDEQVRAASYLLPALLATALPLALLPAAIVVFAVRRPRPSDARAMVLRLAVIVFVVMIPLVAWIAPVNTQAWHKARMPAGWIEQRGIRELTLRELIATDPPRNFTQRGVSRDEELQNRASILLMPFTLSVLGLTVAAGTRRWFLPKALLWWMAVGLVWASLTMEGWWLRDRALGFWAGFIDRPYWISHVLLLCTAAAVHWRHQRRARAARLERLA